MSNITTITSEGQADEQHNSILELCSQAQGEWGKYIAEFADWKGFITLTIDPKKYSSGWSEERFFKTWHWLVGILSRELYGNHYRHSVGHCYFAYCFVVEPHRSDLLHAHILHDGIVHWSRVSDLWQGMFENGSPKNFGICKIETVSDRDGVCRYVAKYVAKSDQAPKIYKPVKRKRPSFEPLWYRDIAERV